MADRVSVPSTTLSLEHLLNVVQELISMEEVVWKEVWWIVE